MKLFILVVLSLATALALPKGPYETCFASKCKLPNCQCADTIPPISGDIPQFVVLSFDDSATKMLSDVMMKNLLYNMKNSDGCSVSGTFFVPHEYTDYQVVNELRNHGFEIGSHSITKTPYVEYWKNATHDVIKAEMGGQVKILSHFANIPEAEITGGRVPQLELNRVALLSEHDALLKYDSSWPSRKKLFCYTMDYDTQQECTVDGCKDIPIPGFWIAPICDWTDQDGILCNSISGCSPKGTADEIFEWMKKNFMEHYNSTKAPFSLRVGLGWYTAGDQHPEALKKFLDYLTSQKGVYIVSQKQLLEWSKNPTHEFKSCQTITQVPCEGRVCVLKHEDQTRYMTACVDCPNNYPWLNNPLGD